MAAPKDSMTIRGIVRGGFGNCHAHMATGPIPFKIATTAVFGVGSLLVQIQKNGNIQKSQPYRGGVPLGLNCDFHPVF
jgi:hypothetical protein